MTLPIITIVFLWFAASNAGDPVSHDPVSLAKPVALVASDALALVAYAAADDPLSGKTLKRTTRRFYKTLLGSTRQWQDWLPGIIVVLLTMLIVPALDRSLWNTWRSRGFAATRTSLALGVAVYLRLLIDPRAPVLGKVLLLLAVVYGVAVRDLAPDFVWPTGWIDDFIAMAVTSRAFLRMCSDSLIEEHAKKAAGRRSWSLRRRAVS